MGGKKDSKAQRGKHERESESSGACPSSSVMPSEDLAAPGSQAAQQSLFNLFCRTGVNSVSIHSTEQLRYRNCNVLHNSLFWLSGQIYTRFICNSSSSVFTLNQHYIEEKVWYKLSQLILAIFGVPLSVHLF